MTIDLNTGLPELSDGMFWRVSPYDSRINDRIINTKIRLFVELIQYHEVEEFYHGPKGWWIFQVYVGKSRKVTRERSVQSLPIIHHYEGEDPVYATQLNLTPELIRQTADKVLENYDKIVESNKLFGDYPPNKLPES